ncbi:hypothetical protein RIR_jg11489.t1 [Rhizophagus irregularis DAOM 181602=DAOM 197198]|uniref:Uncharacterized protein n=1 Tax=Rhizophagus irregularis TaxID=588596 RepID=A0A2N1NH70_9GLOM|nr:hypothetical protein RhiirC2_776288 [Rhizophagus irregularis]GET55784.1 hypothetical protein RIR_jg11489.t1 [Rhizophagus irregularis DAOM 181602=DAOM 197198]
MEYKLSYYVTGIEKGFDKSVKCLCKAQLPLCNTQKEVPKSEIKSVWFTFKHQRYIKAIHNRYSITEKEEGKLMQQIPSRHL